MTLTHDDVLNLAAAEYYADCGEIGNVNGPRWEDLSSGVRVLYINRVRRFQQYFEIHAPPVEIEVKGAKPVALRRVVCPCCFATHADRFFVEEGAPRLYLSLHCEGCNQTVEGDWAVKS